MQRRALQRSKIMFRHVSYNGLCHFLTTSKKALNYAWKRLEMHAKFSMYKCEGKGLLEDLGLDGRIKKLGGMMRTGFIWLSIGTSCGFL
jgi:hypothetical protein